MLELENIAYIDLQKTGSTTIVCALEDAVNEKRIHKSVLGGIPDHFEQGKFTFVSIREPVSLYVSLFTFGAAEKEEDFTTA